MLAMLAAPARVGAAIHVVDPQQAVQPLHAALDFLPDREGKLDAAAARAAFAQRDSNAGHAGPPNLGYIRHSYWVSFSLRNPTDQPISRLLMLRRGAKHEQAIWIGEGSATRQLRIGGNERTTGDIASRHTVVRLSIPAHGELPVLARLGSRTGLVLDYLLVKESAFETPERVEAWVFGALFGLLLAIGGYVLALYAATRERIYIWFAGFCLCMASYLMHFEGYAFAAIWQHRQPFGGAISLYSGLLQIVFTVLFLRSFLKTPHLFPRVDHWLLRPLTFAPLLGIPLFPFDWASASMIAALTSVIAILTVVPVSLVAYRRGQVQLLAFLIAIIAFFVTSVIFLLRQAGILPELPWLTLLQPALSGFAMMLFALAVLQRFRRINETTQAAIRRNEDRLVHMVDERTAQLRAEKQRAEQALAQLQTAQGELVAAEKMASLGQLVAGVAHEINTPIGVALTAVTFLEERNRDFQRRLGEGQLRRSDLDSFAEAAGESTRLVLGNLERASELIRNFKQVSVDRTSEGRRSFDLRQYLEALLDSLSPAWKRRSIELQMSCPEDISMDSFPGPLGQVVTNLVQNALIHGIPEQTAGRISLVATRLDAERIQIVVEDSGVGAPDAVIKRMFDPFFTTRRGSGGTGLGLSIVHNIVTAKLGGIIVAVRADSGGMRFELSLPQAAPGQ